MDPTLNWQDHVPPELLSRREEVKLMLAEALSTTMNEEHEHLLYRAYINCCMPPSDQLHRFTNSQLVQLFGQVVNNLPLISLENYDGTLGWLNNAATDVIRKCAMEGKSLSIHKAETLLDRALLLCSPNHMMRPGIYSNLAQAQMRRFKHSNQAETLEKALENQQKAIQLNRSSDPAVTGFYFHHLGLIQGARFDRCGELEDANNAIDSILHAVSLIKKSNTPHPEFYSSLGELYNARYRRTGDLADLGNAEYNLCLAVRLAENAENPEVGFLSNLSRFYIDRFERFGEIEDSNKSVEFATQALELASDPPFVRAACLSGLGSAFRTKFIVLQDPTDLEIAVSCHEEAISLLPEDHYWSVGISLSYARSLQERFLLLGNIVDIDTALEILLKLSHGEASSYEERASLLDQGLGNAYELRFIYCRDPEDIELSVAHRNTAVEITPKDSYQYPSRLVSLAQSFLDRYGVLQALGDLNKAIELCEAANKRIPEDDSSKVQCLAELGRAYTEVYMHSHNQADIDSAIRNLNAALSVRNPCHDYDSILYSTLNLSYLLRFDNSQDAADLENAIECASQSISKTGSQDAELVLALINRGTAYKLKFLSLGKEHDLNHAINDFDRAAARSVGQPHYMITAALEWASMLKYKNGTPSLEPYRRIVELSPQVLWLGFPIRERYDRVAWALGDKLMIAIQTAIQLKEFEVALEWFEQGHSMIWRQNLQLRLPQAMLARLDPELANEIKNTGESLRHLTEMRSEETTGVYQISGEKSSRLRRKLASTWDGLMKKANHVLGENNPYRPQQAAQLLKAAHAGPVVLINVESEECSALVIQPNSNRIGHVPLPSLSSDNIEDACLRFEKALNSSGIRSRQFRSPIFHTPENESSIFEDILGLLWLDVVEPIIKHLQYEPSSNLESMPRVTWCTTGPLSRLPLHAAGLYDGAHPTSKVYKYMVSSYTPTLTALLNPPNATSEFKGILGVGQANLDSCNALPATIKELDTIAEHAKPFPFTRLDEAQATPDAVLEAMRSHSWVHLACHAEQNTHDPTKSCFQLHNGTLDLSRIAEEPLECAEFAFLAACQTASGDENVPDEAVHLAAGMLMAGYRTVIATMWSINDDDAPLVADQVYAYMMKGGKPDSTRAAKALHLAVQSLRDKIGEDKFGAWVPFIHMGL
ncbi:CHAT domain protein [Ceratobasidium sp. AG-Ba]|nr:CHAT domain protein [Ceratobasidium sp. AG-Ba]